MRFLLPTGIDITERARGERDRHAAEILESITDAFFSLDREWRFTYLNAQAEPQLKRNRGELLGKVIWEEFPAALGGEFERRYRAAMSERRAATFEAYYPEPLDRWYEVNAYPTAEGLAVYFRDITARRRAEESQAYLVELADTLRPLSDPDELQAAASRVLGEHLGANRVAYFEIVDGDYVVERDYAEGVESLVGRYPVASFGAELLESFLAGRTVVESDAPALAGRDPSERAAFSAIRVRGHVDISISFPAKRLRKSKCHSHGGPKQTTRCRQGARRSPSQTAVEIPAPDDGRLTFRLGTPCMLHPGHSPPSRPPSFATRKIPVRGSTRNIPLPCGSARGAGR